VTVDPSSPPSRRKEVEAALRVEKTLQKEDYEKGKRVAHTFQVNDYFWLSAKNIAIKLPTWKLGDRYLGPFLITEKIGDPDYRLQLPDWLSRHHPVFHVDKLHPWKGSVVNGVLPPSPEPCEIEGVDERDVHEVWDSRWNEVEVEPEGRKMRRRKAKTVKWFECLVSWFEYLVSWLDYDGAATWELEENLANTCEKVDDFHRQHPSAPQLPNYKPTSVIEDDEA
jgi:hypothetical protein